MKTCVIFGGSGFIGTHLTLHLLRQQIAQTIWIADLVEFKGHPYSAEIEKAYQQGRVRFVHCDVREPIPAGLLPDQVDVIFNFAAIHREPGPPAAEFFKTNLLGAEHVCAYATRIHCKKIVFTSSISPYGPTEAVKNEQSLPAPETPYGSSKLGAEDIHQKWQQSSIENKLILLRPGVVFGPGEGGNVTRLIHSLVHGYFVYMGNRETRKAGGYVKELCWVTQFALEAQSKSGEPVLLLNFSADPTPTLEMFVEAICTVAGVERKPLSLPRWLLMAGSYPVAAVADLFHIIQPINPTRMRKLFRSNNIEPKELRTRGYQYHYTLEEAFADWKKDFPSDFAR